VWSWELIWNVDFDELRETAQRRLIEFLETDLELAFTFVSMAQTRREGPSRQRLLQHAREAVDAVRRFEGRITDARAGAAIHERADELQRLLSTFRA
jgi:hypothetical protein